MNPREIDIEREISMIFRIVMRNVTLEGWQNLLPEAQEEMLEEVVSLMSCEFLTRENKQQLAMRINHLKNYVIVNYRQRIIEILEDFKPILGEEKQAA